MPFTECVDVPDTYLKIGLTSLPTKKPANVRQRAFVSRAANLLAEEVTEIQTN
jgi:hypothetical protein